MCPGDEFGNRENARRTTARTRVFELRENDIRVAKIVTRTTHGGAGDDAKRRGMTQIRFYRKTQDATFNHPRFPCIGID